MANSDASTQLSDVYVPVPFEAGVDEAAIELNKFIQSGIMVTSPKLSMMAGIGGSTGEVPFHQPLVTSVEPNLSSDAPDSFSTPAVITTGKMTYRLASLNGSWSTMDLTRELALMDPLAAISRKVGGWWATQQEKRLIASVNGIIADNVAANSGDMGVDIYVDATPTEASTISADAILNAKQTMGDHADELVAIAMHSVTYTTLQKQNLIDFIPNSMGVINIPVYLGYRVIVDDSLTVTSGTTAPAYTTILFSTGAFDHGKGDTMNPSELERAASAGMGGGQDILHSRTADIIHPYGFRADGTPAGQSFTLAELALATTWARVVDRKNVGISYLIHNC